MPDSDISFFSNQEGDGLPNSNEYTIQQKDLQEIYLALTKKQFNAKKWMEKFSVYSNNHKRILYSILSGLIVKEKKQISIDYITSHLDSLSQQITKENENLAPHQIPVEDSVYDAFYKFFDHCSLAIAQRTIYNQSDELSKKRTEKIVKDQMSKAIEERVSEYDKNITNQLIGLVSIFTAISFILFGGINSFESLISKLSSVEAVKLLFAGILWFICMFNLLFIFIKFIASLTGRKPTLWPYFFIVNIILIGCFIFIICKFKIFQAS